jgi:hypothetical protein
MDHVTFMQLFAIGADRSVDQEAFTTPGTFNFIVPPNVYSISWVGIQGGQGGGTAGGNGGYLAYLDNIPVTPNETLTIVTGAGGTSVTFNPNTTSVKGAVGGHSSLKRGSTTLATTDPAITIPGIVRFAGGVGGFGRGGQYGDGGGGGGAGGYSGVGGDGASYSSGVITNASSGSGGAGGGGGITQGYFVASTLWVGFLGGMGGGTDLKGQGSSGSAGTSVSGDEEKSAAANSTANGGTGSLSTASGGYGGGGGGGRNTVDTTNGNTSPSFGQNGRGGAVQLIWPGTLRQYPSTRTADE